MSTAILISGQTSRSIYKYQNLNMIKSFTGFDIYIVLSDTYKIATNYIHNCKSYYKNDRILPYEIDYKNIYEYYSKFSNNVNLKIIDERIFNEDIKKIFNKIYKKYYKNNKNLINLIKNDRFDSNIKMMYLRFLVLEFCKNSNKAYKYLFYFREDSKFIFPLFLDYYKIIVCNNLLLKNFNKFPISDKYPICDKIFFGRSQIFDTLFGVDINKHIFKFTELNLNLYSYFATENFYKKLIDDNKIKTKECTFFIFDVRFVNNKMSVLPLYKLPIQKIYSLHIYLFFINLINTNLFFIILKFYFILSIIYINIGYFK